ncbi:hypothetical protein [Paenibacillus sp. NEAU-GSW1]|uniref:hypothetical protein n=1 Tax=Paenibacillus sp. NEAU-GSW1 TaxID=2682486 RepID=UPI0012E2512D|nr:hypothetical protein [Paenibacillus sp. NEAU-GSW1]MUT67090.1 hypothetical protein [Paenibacillus sp. NEAU-GSW1]
MEAEDTITKMITKEEFAAVSDLFRQAYPYLIHEIERVESERGKLNDFQLLRAVSRAKQSIAVVNWDYRKMVNAVFDAYVEIYKETGRKEADEWAIVTFGCSRYIKISSEDQSNIDENDAREQHDKLDEASLHILMNELTLQMEAKEAELLQLYEQFQRLQKLARELTTEEK